MAQRTILIMGRVLDQEDGLGVYADNLLRNMFRLDGGSRWIVLLRTPRHARRFDDFPHVRTEVVPARVKLLWDQWVVPRLARRFGADLVFNPKFSLPLLGGRPGVFVLHGSDWYVNPQNYEWWDNLYIRIMMPLYARRAAGMAAISETIVRDLVRHAGIDASKVRVTHAAPSPSFTSDAAPAELEAFGREYDLPDRFMFTVARAYHSGHGKLPPYPGGNLERLARAYAAYRRAGGELPLVVAGERIRDYLLARGFSDEALEGMRFLGFVPHERIHCAYRLAEFFVLVTLYESFALPVVEAMACGCPVLGPATGAVPEVAGPAGLLVDPLDEAAITAAMQRLSEDGRLRDRLAAAGRERVGRFTWEETARRTLQLFDEVAPPP